MKTWADFRIEIPSGRSGEVDTLCPQCSPTRKKKHVRCLSVNTDKGTWFCQHCGYAGSLNQGEHRVDTGWQKPRYQLPKPIQPKPRNQVEAWFSERGISTAILERNHVVATSIYMPQVEDFVGAIAFPYYRGDELINVKYRDREKNFRMEAGAERVLYGLNDIEAGLCVIVEGEIDKLSVEAAGIVSCVSVPDGAPATNAKDYASKFAFLEADIERIGTVKQWVLAVDNDEPGQRLEDELSRRLGREKCKRVRWPAECKDANDVLRSHGAQVLRECLDLAEPLPLDGVFDAQDISSRVSLLHVNGWDKAVATGWDELDRFYTVRPGELTVLTGIPGSGKSNFLDALLINMAMLHGWRFMLFSPENQPVEDHAARMLEKRLMKPFFEGPTQRATHSEAMQGLPWVCEHFFWYLPPDEADWTVDNVLQTARALVYRYGIRGLVIDPWNEFECSRPREQTESEYIGSCLRKIRQFARRHGVHVWVVNHPTKLDRNKDGDYPVPTLYDVAGSANWRNKADNGLCVWRDFGDDNAPIAVHIQKVRFRQNGKLGVAKFEYRKPTATYHELPFFDRRNA